MKEKKSILLWKNLAICGAPIMLDKLSKTIPNKKILINTLKSVLKTSLNSKEKEALESFLLALQMHFPSFFKSNIFPHFKLHPLLKLRNITGKHIKLKRIAHARLATYL